MEKMKKVLLLVLCAALLVGATISGTVAYLTSKAEVQNTFTVGHVAITMDEFDYDDSTANADRDIANVYKLIPGHTYVKDPTIHVAEGSETCYVFVEISNEVAAYIDVVALETQMKNNGWEKMEDGIWWQHYTKAENADRNLEVFESFTVLKNADKVDGWATLNANMNIVAYAVQSETFGSAEDAWNATFGAPANG